ncbi:conserved protein of unknown function [Petrocella atlantisensis]|uniref:Chaperone protein DnaK n=1 Tax=Petrocella atlantisensis TaxID=2173034 RepID=A0A3P7RVN1_9FIRM|nr:Hsp70 family protein [Petrocella atlantisensis]VDN46836.1 conserved protein of unknown function [Petrocella atlantisensis]
MGFLGIDLGTTNSVAVIYDDKNDVLNIVKIEGMEEVLASAVCILEDEIIVGSEAKNSAIIYPEETILSIKRQMGESYATKIGEKTYLPEDISAILLEHLKKAAQQQSEEIYDEVVITHPAYFNDRQIYATKKAGELAGFKQVHLLSEPLASAIEYGYKQGYAQTLLVYDLGGGTFDACVLKVIKDLDGHETFQELADVGDMHLGGDDFDQILVDYMVEQFRVMTGIRIQDIEARESARVRHKLKQEAELLKKKLSSTNKASVKIYPLMVHEGLPLNLSLEVTKDEFEALIRPMIDKSKDIINEALKRADQTPDDISKVILVGGSTLVPMVKRMVAGFIKEPYRATDPAKSVAMGAALYNYLIHLPNSQVKVGQITRQNFGTEAITNIMTKEKSLIPIIPMGSTIPIEVTDDGYSATSGASTVRVDVFQWEEGHEEEKKYTGSLMLEGISDDARISVKYAINSDNLFEVTVRDKSTEKEISGVFDRKKTMPRLPDVEKHSAVEGEGLNIVFLMDTTGSMDTYIDGVKEKAIAFSNILEARKIDYNLGLIGFGDLLEKEKPKVYKWTKDIHKFQKKVTKIPRTCGGDIPESSMDALETGIDLLKKLKNGEGFKNIFILITDAPPHIPTISGKSVEDVVNALIAQKITTYVVAKKDYKSLEAYEPLTRTGGRYYSMQDDFMDILDAIAYAIADLVKTT